MTMDGWTDGDEGLLLRIDPESTCGNDDGGVVFVLLDGFGEVVAVWQDDETEEDGVLCSRSHEIEDGSFVSILEERFPSGRTNYDREIELDELETVAEEELPSEEEIRELLRRFVRARGPRD
jgi:hypothetical protein